MVPACSLLAFYLLGRDACALIHRTPVNAGVLLFLVMLLRLAGEGVLRELARFCPARDAAALDPTQVPCVRQARTSEPRLTPGFCCMKIELAFLRMVFYTSIDRVGHRATPLQNPGSLFFAWGFVVLPTPRNIWFTYISKMVYAWRVREG